VDIVRDYHELLMNAPMLVTVQRGKELRLELINLFARRAIGERDLVGKTVPEAFPELDRWLAKISSVVRSGEPYIGVDEPLTFDWSGTGTTETRYLTLVCQPLLSNDGAIDGSVMFAIDVTKSVLARAMDPPGREWFEAALDVIATPVVLATPGSRRILFANAAARKLSHGELVSGTTFGQAMGLDTGYFLTDASGARVPDNDLPASKASRGEIVDAVKLRWHTPLGVIPLVCFAEMVPAANGLPPVVVLSFFDTSNHERLERDLQDAMAARDAFIELAGHELRTPLTALKLQIQSLLRKYPQVGGLAAIDRATKRMDEVVEQLLESARIDDGRAPLDVQDLDLCVLVDGVIERLRPEAARTGSMLGRRGAPSIRGRWDRVRLEHVCAHLLANALRFGAGTPIEVDCQDLGDRASMAVIDHGIGIDPADHAHIFERFGRAVSARNFGGLGLGLWMTRALVTQMGGSIVVHSAAGMGATFVVELPKVPPTRAPSAPKRAP
jgi:signal transduction histidine kinase